MIKIAVLISNKGTGTNLQAIIDGIKDGKINGKIVVVVSDTSKAIGLKRAKKNNLKIEICPEKNQLISIVKKYHPDYIVLAGWKQIITSQIIDSFPNKILNLHPGLIPDKLNGVIKNPDGTNALWNRGLLAQKAVNNFLEKKATYGGSSIHFLTKQFDFGPVLKRTFVKIKLNDTTDSLYKRIKKSEHKIYVDVLQELARVKKITVCVIDGGGRAHALVKKYRQSLGVGKIIVIPGNDLILLEKDTEIFFQTKTTDVAEIIKICTQEKADIVDVAQDDAVEVGLTDALLKKGFKVFGPTKSAGQIEWDKAWSRNFMKKFNIPHPAFKICTSEKEGMNFLKKQKDSPWWVKASGLAAGKGALFAPNDKEAIEKIREMKNFGKSGKTFLVEENLEGEEFSSFAIVNGESFALISHAQDHKTVFDGNLGPNTGGMGCSSPPMVINSKVEKQIKRIFKKTVEGLSKLRRNYVGILYLGGIINKNSKVSVIEFNARWGDPEAQVILPSIKNDYLEMVEKALSGKIPAVKKDKLYRIIVAGASRGYPTDHSKVIGHEIKGLDKIPKTNLFGAGIKKQKNKYVASGGRLFYVLGEGKNVDEARKRAYNLISLIKISGNNLHYRTDIGDRDLQRILSETTA